jgi:hypothetical protein
MTDYIARAKQSAKRAATALAVLSGIAAAFVLAAPVPSLSRRVTGTIPAP